MDIEEEVIHEAAVEAAAKGIYRYQTGGMDWDSRSDVLKQTVRGNARAALEAAAPHMLAGAWEQGFRACNMEWEQTAILVTPDEDRFVATNPYR